MGAPKLYPLRFAEILKDWGFGNRWIAEAFAKTGLPEGHGLSETWEVCDRPGESSRILNGPLAGRTLGDAIALHGEALLGREAVARGGRRFPLLIKFLDVSKILNEQAHPDDELARRRGLEDPGKTESWYIVKTRPGAFLELGSRPGVTREEVFQSLLDGTSRSCMVRQELKPGDCFLLHAGTMHYGEGGVLLYELLQNSMAHIGLRHEVLGHTPEQRRASAEKAIEGVHLEDGLDARTVPVVVEEPGLRRTFLSACHYFALERLDLAAPARLELDGDKFLALTLIEGKMTVRGGDEEVILLPGLTTLLPAALGPVQLVPDGRAAALKAYAPDLLKDVVTPLRSRGIADRDIAALGARTRLNHLLPLLESRNG